MKTKIVSVPGFVTFGTVTVDTRLTFSQRVSTGDYQHIDSSILGLRPKGTRSTKRKLLYAWRLVRSFSSRGISSRVMFDDMEKQPDSDRGWRLANHKQGLAFGATYPDLQIKFHIILLGDIFSIGEQDYALILSSGASKRRTLLLDLVNGGAWDSSSCFLQVQEISR